MAIWTDRTESLNGVDVRTGDRAFQSVNVILNPNRPHDYKDDLQSFFWVLVWLCLRYRRPSQPKPTFPGLLQVWSGENSRTSALERRYALEYFEEIVVPQISRGFTLPFINLLRKLRNLIWAQCHEASKPYVPCSCPGSPTTLEELCPNADEDYTRFLSAIEQAIEEAEEEEARKKLENEREREVTGMPHLRPRSSDAKPLSPAGSDEESSNPTAAPTCRRHPKKTMQRPGDQSDANINPVNSGVSRPINPLPRRVLKGRASNATKAQNQPQLLPQPSSTPVEGSRTSMPKRRRQAEGDAEKRAGKRPRNRRRNASPPQVIPGSPRLPDIRPEDARPPPPATVSPGGHVFLARSTRSMNVDAYSSIGFGVDFDAPPLSSPTRGYSQMHQPFEFTFTSTTNIAPTLPSTPSNEVTDTTPAVTHARRNCARATRTTNLARSLFPVLEVDSEEQAESLPPSSPENSSEDEDPA
ncbi:hypothetical protein AX16_009035 [Volvariella volvacea WC 439]|nr:hypothetical protein AX16_009035 [Volvariella volvacea WC 439]